MPVEFAICAIAKNEGRYLAEWIEYHRLVGCAKFFIYDNDSTDDTRDVLAPYIASGLAELVAWSVKPYQITAYAHALRERLAKHDARWCAFIDLDEFIVVEGAATVPDVLRGYRRYGALAVHWRTFGSSGHIARPGGLVIEDYTWRLPDDATVNRHYKSILNLDRVQAGAVINSHAFHLTGGRTKNERGAPYSPPRWPWCRPPDKPAHLRKFYDEWCGHTIEKVGKSRMPSHERIYIHHYFLKSRQDWDARVRRGSVNRGAYSPDKLRLFDLYDPRCSHYDNSLAARFGDLLRARLGSGAGLPRGDVVPDVLASGRLRSCVSVG